MPDKKPTDNEIKKALECCGKNPPICNVCGYRGRCNRIDCYDYLKRDALDLINRLQAENEEKEEHIMELQGINESIKSDKAFLGKEIEKYHKELLKSKVFKFVRNQNRIYNIMDFQDGEILMFYDYPEKPSALSKGYLLFKGKDDIKLANVSEVKELSYAEIKAEAYKEFAERLKEAPIKCALPLSGLSAKDEIEDYFNDIMLQVRDVIDNLLKELVGENNA